MQQIMQTLKTHIHARYPLLYLLSHEEERIQKILLRLVQQENRSLYIWKNTSGLLCNETAISETMDVNASLAYFSKQTEPSILVLCDVHHEFSSSVTLRWLRDLSIQMGQKSQNIIINRGSAAICDNVL